MNKDIRVAISFFNHRKTKKLIRKYGLPGAWGLLRLWSYAADSRPSGYLTGMSNSDILDETHMDDHDVIEFPSPDDFVEFMVSECKWIDRTENGLYLHDWHIHNPWAAKAEDRSDKGRFSRMALTHPNIFNELREKGVDAISRPEYDRLTACQRNVKVTLSPAPAPAPAPAPGPAPAPDPTPKSKAKNKKPLIPMPENFGLSDEVKSWALKKGFGNLEEHLESFKLKAASKEYRYADWDAALKNAIRDDWAKIRVGGNGNGKNISGDSRTGERAEPGKYAAALEGKAGIAPE